MNCRTLLLANIDTTNSVITDNTDCCKPIITVGVVGGGLTKMSRDAGTTPGHLNRLTERCTIPWTPGQPPGQWNRCVIVPASHQVHRHYLKHYLSEA